MRSALTVEGEFATLAHDGAPNSFVTGRIYIINNTSYTVLSSRASPYIPTMTLVRLKENN